MNRRYKLEKKSHIASNLHTLFDVKNVFSSQQQRWSLTNFGGTSLHIQHFKYLYVVSPTSTLRRIHSETSETNNRKVFNGTMLPTTTFKSIYQGER